LRDTEQVRRVLDSLTVLLDGNPAAATTVHRKRAVFYNALGFAVERKPLPANPIDQVQWTAPEVADAIDRRVVVGPELARRLIAAVSDTGRRGDHLRVFFACLYFAGLRPSEAIALRVDNCELPETGWGRLVLTGSEPRAGADWTDDGNPREARELKRRGTAATRVVPIPLELVAILREHIAACGIGTQARLFRSESGGPLHETSYYGAWRKARAAMLSVAQQRSPLV